MQQDAFSGQCAVITGAAQGIGFEIARKLAERGCHIVLNDVHAKALEESQAAIEAAGGRCIMVPGDAGDITVIRRMIDLAVATFGRVDIAVANAGITLFGSFLEYEPDDFNKLMKLNLGGSFFLAQAAANQMVRQGAGGRILFISSVTGHQAHKNLAAYGMSKAALEMLAKSLVIELSPHKITVNAIAPGATTTNRTTNDNSYVSTWSRITPMGRPASTDDIAHAALFILSHEAGHITGQTLIVDGGWTSVSPSPE